MQARNVMALLPDREPDRLTRMEHAVISYSVQHEMARTLADLLFVSTYWGHERGPARENRLGPVRRMAELLQWDDNRIEQELEKASY
jgi:hypothetical protein